MTDYSCPSKSLEGDVSFTCVPSTPIIVSQSLLYLYCLRVQSCSLTQNSTSVTADTEAYTHIMDALLTLSAACVRESEVRTERVLIIGGLTDAPMVVAAKDLFKSCITPIVHVSTTALIRPTDVAGLAEPPVRPLHESIHPSHRMQRYTLIVCIDLPHLLRADQLKSSLQDWQYHLDRQQGRILVELQREQGMNGSQEHFLITEARYRTMLGIDRFEITKINAVPRDNYGISSVVDIRTAVYQIDTFSRMIEDFAPRQAVILRERARGLMADLRDPQQNTTKRGHHAEMHFLNRLLAEGLFALVGVCDMDNRERANLYHFHRILNVWRQQQQRQRQQQIVSTPTAEE